MVVTSTVEVTVAGEATLDAVTRDGLRERDTWADACKASMALSMAVRPERAQRAARAPGATRSKGRGERCLVPRRVAWTEAQDGVRRGERGRRGRPEGLDARTSDEPWGTYKHWR